MRWSGTENSHVWLMWAGLLFTIIQIMVVHSSTAMIFKDVRSQNTTHPLLDTTNLPAFLLHSLAYYIACFATTVFLLICAAIILVLATMSMELIAEAFHAISGLLARSWRDRARQQSDPDAEVLDTYCDSWNYR